MHRSATVLTQAIILVAILTATGMAAAQGTLYKVVDRYGNVTYQDQPPVNDSDVKTETISVAEPEDAATEVPSPGDPARIQAAVETRPLVLFTVPQCDSCDFVRWALQERELPFEEVDVRNSIENQQRLQQATGEFRVPVLMVGEQPLFGYDRAALMSELASAGYIEGEPATVVEEPGAVEGEDTGNPDSN